jgi:hypothetical protein
MIRFLYSFYYAKHFSGYFFMAKQMWDQKIRIAFFGLDAKASEIFYGFAFLCVLRVKVSMRIQNEGIDGESFRRLEKVMKSLIFWGFYEIC